MLYEINYVFHVEFLFTVGWLQNGAAIKQLGENCK